MIPRIAVVVSITTVLIFSWAPASGRAAGETTSRALPSQSSDSSESTPVELLDNQARLTPFVEEIQHLVDPTDSGVLPQIQGGNNRYSGITLNLSGNFATLYWAGPTLPSSIAEISETAKVAGVEIRWAESRYSLDEIWAGRAAIEKMFLSDDWRKKVSLLVSTPSADGSKISVLLSASSDDVVGDEIAKAISSVTTVPVSIELMKLGDIGNEPRLTATRQNDSTPWYGGAGIAFPATGSYCSTGIGVTSIASGLDYVLTAKHCLDGLSGSSGTVYDAALDALGGWSTVSTRNSSVNDATLLRPTSGAASKQIYVGSFSSANSVPITSFGSSTIGAIYCTDGAMSGQHCNVVVTAKGSNVTIEGHNFTNVQTASTSAPAGTIAVAGGDSGGPVFLPQSATSNNYKGSIIAGAGALSSCPQLAVPGNPCYGTVFFSSANHVLADLGMSLHN
jgi:hypothetical protein